MPLLSGIVDKAMVFPEIEIARGVQKVGARLATALEEVSPTKSR